MNKPKITIYMPTKNRLEFLKNAVGSVVNQTYTNWELIVVNDASTDETKDYLENLAIGNPKIKAIHHEVSQGACISRNDAIFSASGEFITGLDDDDEFTPDRLQVFVDNWSDDPNVIALSAYKSNKIDGVIETHKKALKTIYIVQKDLLYKNDVGNQIFVKTADLQKIGGFNKDYKMWQDFDCWYRILNNSKIIKKIPYNTYIFEHSERPDRLTHSGAANVINSYKLFVKKNNLNYRRKNILKFQLLGYGVKSYNMKFYLDMLFNTVFDTKTITKLNNEYLKPILKNAVKTNQN